MYEHLLFLLYWFLNSLVLYLLGLLFPASVVLGTWRLTMVEAAIYAGFWLTFFVWTMWEYVLFRKVKLEPFTLRFIFFFVVNALGIWLVARYAAYTGLGIASFWWAFALGAVTNLLQAVAWKLLGDKLKG
ncbi:hypothetical protein A3E46_02165 [Candidatus Woesebacteria bacterium RIFCSPHIGHO2_12_FULL_46_16]|uniref:Uncharacterized protein n=1 Tax=Candidatus Woesebacteria bacterium RIFCSPHIGHO2_12_FULL_46_16 TaxID=1802513 RepID=A0A1F8B079_9BACT|nr:MAG: hypothetical protein A3E46_02165 [Candidatus Woesebacteria bacterium RIFCSPHIGHO2_12_FULL_46_16]